MQGHGPGVSTRDIATTVQTAIRGVEASKYRIGEDEYDIRVRLRPESRVSIEELGNLTVPDEDGIPIPIRGVARLETGVGPAAIRRVDLRRVVTIEGDVVRAPGRTDDTVRAEVAGILDGEVEWPAATAGSSPAPTRRRTSPRSFLQRAFVIAVLLIAVVLVTQFNSLILPATVMISVLLSLIGVLWGLLLTRTPFGIVMTGIGVISLAGVVVNNAIVLCDFVVRLRNEGMEKTRAVVEAGAIRLRPVLLTAVTTVLGPDPADPGDQHRLLRWHARVRRRELAVVGPHGGGRDRRAHGRDGADAGDRARHVPHPRRAPRLRPPPPGHAAGTRGGAVRAPLNAARR